MSCMGSRIEIGRIWLLLCGGLVVATIMTGDLQATVEPNGDCVGIFFYKSGSKECESSWPDVQQAIDAGWAIRTSNVETEYDLAKRMQIRTLPTLLLLRNGREVDRILGITSLRDIEHRMTAASSPDSLRHSNRQHSTANSSLSDMTVRGQSQPATIPVEASGMGASVVATGAVVPAVHQSMIQSYQTQSNQIQQPIDQRPPSDPAGATVRIRVDEPSHEAIGTGTIIDTYNGEALVLTCGHLFRDTRGSTPIIVETFFGGQVRSYQAWLIDFRADETDIGLISFRPEVPVPVARLMDHRERLREGETVFSWGCDHGAAPSRRDSQISKLNRYLGPANVEVWGKPVQGRSGGGLFNSRGELIGVCYAADDELNEGLYNAPEVVYEQLLKLGLRRLFEHQSAMSQPATQSVQDISPSLAASMALASSTTPAQPRSRRMLVTLEENGRTQQIEIQDPSPRLIDAIQQHRLIR